jgi:large subunit ribosomal protein L9
MKVIFIEDVPNVARAGQAKEVADGYGRNYLLPRKLAVLANSRASAIVEAQLKKLARRQAQTEAEMRELAAKLNGLEVMLKVKAGTKGRLYGSITGADIADELGRAGLVVDKRKIELEPIHELGSYDVTVRFTHDITAVIKLALTAEAGVGEEVKEEAAKAEKVEEKAEKQGESKGEKKPKARKKAKKAEGQTEAKKAEKKPRASKKKAEKKVEEAKGE